MGNTAYAVQLARQAFGTWTWEVMDDHGYPAAAGAAQTEAVAREEAEFFRRALTRLGRAFRGW